MKQLGHYETPKTRGSVQIRILCDGITLAANRGVIFRLADAFGVEKVYFNGPLPNLTGKKVKRVSRSTHQWIPHQHCEDLKKEIRELKKQAYRIISLEITHESQPVYELEIPEERKIALLIGSEKEGISPELLELSDHIFHIPIFGKNSSMNVSSALAILLYEIIRKESS